MLADQRHEQRQALRALAEEVEPLPLGAGRADLADDSVLNCQSPPQVLESLVRSALRGGNDSQVLEQDSVLRVVLPQGGLADVQSLFQQRPGGGVIAAAAATEGQVVEVVGPVRMVVSQRSPAN